MASGTHPFACAGGSSEIPQPPQPTGMFIPCMLLSSVREICFLDLLCILHICNSVTHFSRMYMEQKWMLGFTYQSYYLFLWTRNLWGIISVKYPVWLIWNDMDTKCLVNFPICLSIECLLVCSWLESLVVPPTDSLHDLARWVFCQ